MYKLCLRDRAWELHRSLGNKPSLGPELIGERAKVSRVPMHREGVNRYGGSFWEVTNSHSLASNIWRERFGVICILRTKGPPL